MERFALQWEGRGAERIRDNAPPTLRYNNTHNEVFTMGCVYDGMHAVDPGRMEDSVLSMQKRPSMGEEGDSASAVMCSDPIWTGSGS